MRKILCPSAHHRWPSNINQFDGRIRCEGIEIANHQINGRDTVRLKIRKVLREEVKLADVVHTSNFFPPYTCLAYAHDLAVRLGKKTVFVIAEDFHDMLSWEWVRPSLGLNRWRRERSLRAMDSITRKCAGTASLTMMQTPAAVERYRLSARNSVMIRQPGHEESQVIAAKDLNARLSSLGRGRALQLTTACRHASLKGLDLLIRAIGLLRERGTIVYANLYGSGPETERLRQLTVALGVAHLVQLPGNLAVGEQLDGHPLAAHVAQC